MKTSVAVCTYNGEQYIAEQLWSIISQTQSVDEIVICDDRSSDGTIPVINEIQANTSIPVRLYINEVNLGCRANFQKAIGLCTGDIIFLSDQDDIWVPDKVEKIIKWFESNNDKEVVFTDGTFIDAAGKPYAQNASLYSSYGMTKRAMKWMRKGYALELFLKNNKATGATMAFRKEILDGINLDCSSEKDTPYHDAQICLYAIQRNSLGCMPECLISYRIHKGQDCGVHSVFSPLKTDNVLSPLSDYMVLGRYITDEKIMSRYQFISSRQEWVLSGSVLSVIKRFKCYISHYSTLGIMCFVRDIALCVKFTFFKH